MGGIGSHSLGSTNNLHFAKIFFVCFAQSELFARDVTGLKPQSGVEPETFTLPM